MTTHRLSPADARRIAVRAQLLEAGRPAGLLELVRHLTLLQLDPTAAVAPSADLVAWSRLGGAYEPADLAGALGRRDLVELAATVRPAEDIALYRAEMSLRREEAPGAWKYQRHLDWIRANDACRRDILARLAAEGPLPSRVIPDTCVVPWASTGWTNDQNVIRLLDLMAARGEVAVAGRQGRDRLWDLAERVYPDETPVPAQDAPRCRSERRLRALGIARAKTTEVPIEPWGVGDVGEPATVDGVKGTWRVDPEQLGRLGEPLDGRVALLSPFDRLIHDRKRAVELFGFDYGLEMYKPAANRRWGYYALPILHGDRLVGKLDAAADRKAGVLRVRAVHEDEPFDAATAAAVDAEIAGLAAWLRLEVAR
ncbi:YcaQ family DNA glycosylase [Dactylosporangium aurantiacum]|uniref:YcaQ family DNA glycosylase n=1 Tax=Dactylosporangium aurantiacum TaxID=35754 RepID=A0A9Q9MK24_9ACTN|nr:crosslink repair DNA glycosylase YcaQ family protein [Dactylosporangium aurantiacum]MDG6101754.1 crosslink repair DNA glycosylase YcaQ family protein [Dactylosporangium aurantiacum]UWZ52437.1 YcaQ family DNA glycosylase [Dactylosporangium aurantiacum]